MLQFTNTHNVGSDDDVNNHPNDDNEGSNWWNKEDLWVVSNILGRAFHDGNTNFDVCIVTEDTA